MPRKHSTLRRRETLQAAGFRVATLSELQAAGLAPKGRGYVALTGEVVSRRQAEKRTLPVLASKSGKRTQSFESLAYARRQAFHADKTYREATGYQGRLEAARAELRTSLGRVPTTREVQRSDLWRTAQKLLKTSTPPLRGKGTKRYSRQMAKAINARIDALELLGLRGKSKKTKYVPLQRIATGALYGVYSRDHRLVAGPFSFEVAAIEASKTIAGSYVAIIDDEPDDEDDDD